MKQTVTLLTALLLTPLALRAADAPYILIREALQFENIGDSGRVPGTIRLLYQHLPGATITLWPAANTGGTLNLWSYKPLTGVVYLSDPIVFPPGYLEVLKFNLAVSLASEFPMAVLDPWVGQKAMETKARLAQLNAVTIGAPNAPLRPVPLQQPLQETDLEQGHQQTP